jgi:hypothetical protein
MDNLWLQYKKVIGLGQKEGYGDVHLHYDGYPADVDTSSNSCKWSPSGKAPYQPFVPETPMYPQQCHVEYCHPGSWQGKCGGQQQPIDMPVMLPQEEAGFLESLIKTLFGGSMKYAILGVIVALLVYYYIRRK